MIFAYPSQRLQDAISQQWCIWWGQRLKPSVHDWLVGPFGNVDTIGDAFIHQLAKDEGLEIQRGDREGGLLSSIDDLGLSVADKQRLNPSIIDFYEHTAAYDLDLRFRWDPVAQHCAWLVNRLYGDRLKQLNFPIDHHEFAKGVASEVIHLRNPISGRTQRTIWFRTLPASGRVLYAGIYSTCRLPSGRRCVKATFPLPRGNATVIMAPQVMQDGSLRLSGAGSKCGDPGFYFLLNDARGDPWIHYIRSFREYLHVTAAGPSSIRARHTISLWQRPVVSIHYRMHKQHEPERR